MKKLLLFAGCGVLTMLFLIRQDNSTKSQAEASEFQRDTVVSSFETPGKARDATTASKGSPPAKVTTTTTLLPHEIEPASQQVKAKIKVGEREHEAGLNSLGEFDRILVKPREQIGIQFNYPSGKAGDVVSVQVLDGGDINGKQVAILKLEEDGKLQFSYRVSELNGVHRVLMRNGAQSYMLDFWAGPEQEVASADQGVF